MSAADVQGLLRFLSQDAKVPLAVAMSKVKELQEAQLASPEALAKSDATTIKTFFPDEKLAKQILSAAKRISKKRAAGGDETGKAPTPRKKARADPFETPGTKPAAEVEESLQLPSSDLTEGELENIVVVTNRAPLVLAFAVALLVYTMPAQPLSSRLSLAQAVVSVNSQVKAKSIGITTGNTAEEDGWGQGQPVVKVMNRDISVLKRWGYDWRTKDQAAEVKDEHGEAKAEEDDGGEPALWGIDLDQLKKLNGPLTFNATSTDTAGLPVYSPQSARSYLLRSFNSEETAEADGAVSPKKPKKKTAREVAAGKEENLSHVLKALDLLLRSWSEHLTPSELDKRAWTWYVNVRPEVEHGVAGWGAKGRLRLHDILELRRKP